MDFGGSFYCLLDSEAYSDSMISKTCFDTFFSNFLFSCRSGSASLSSFGNRHGEA